MDELAAYCRKGQNVVYYCHRARRNGDAWQKKMTEFKRLCSDAHIIVLTYHRGTQRFGIDRSEMVMLDDMKIGLNMCRAAGVDFIFADWARKPAHLRREMRELADYTAESILDVEKILFEE